MKAQISRKKGDAVMRIDAYNQIAQLYGVNKTTAAQKNSKSASTRDEFTISSAGKDLQIAKTAVAQASDIREDKVALLKNKIDSGEYSVSPDDFAVKLLEKYNSL